MIVAVAFCEFVDAQIGEAVAGEGGDADAAARGGAFPAAGIPGAVVDVCLLADVFETLALEEAALVPLAVGATVEEGPLVHGFAEVDAVVAEDIVPRRFAVPDFEDKLRFTVGHDWEMAKTAAALRAFLEA